MYNYAGLATGTYHWKYIDSVLDNTKYLLALTIVGKGDFASGNRIFEVFKFAFRFLTKKWPGTSCSFLGRALIFCCNSFYSRDYKLEHTKTTSLPKIFLVLHFVQTSRKCNSSEGSPTTNCNMSGRKRWVWTILQHGVAPSGHLTLWESDRRYLWS